MTSPYAVLPDIYDAAINPGRWKCALDGIARTTDAKAIAMVIRNQDPAQRNLTLMSSEYLAFSRRFWGVYYGLRLTRLQEQDWDYLSLQRPFEPIADTEMGKDVGLLDQRKDYACLRKRVGVGRRLGVRLNADRLWFDAMSIGFSTEFGDVPFSSRKAIAPLLPHISKAVEMGRIFRHLKARYKSVLSVLDRVGVGLAVALPSGEILIENAETRRIFNLKDGVTKAPNGHLRCHNVDQTEQARAHILSAASTAAGEGQHPEYLMALTRPSGKHSLLLDITPLRDTRNEIETNLEGALITLIDPCRIPNLKLAYFVKLYQFTGAETEVFRLVLEGMTVETIAEHRNTAPATAKNQIASILQKTGVHRRSELIRLVIRVLPPVN